MALSSRESLLLEEIKSMLDDKAELGLAIHKDANNDLSNTNQWERENAYNQFVLDATDLVHHEGITAAFKKVHDFLPLDSLKFVDNFTRDMTAQGIPGEEIQKAIKIYFSVRDKFLGKSGRESDSGWHPQLDEVLATANPED
jgi:hypothetical protein